jgi:DNA-binding NarL/FixJ family response regulator
MMPFFVDSKSAFLFTSLLLIGQNPEILDTWVRTLSRRWYYYCILKAGTAEYGLEIVRSKTLDCVVLDLDLPHSGLQMLHHIIPDRHHAPLAVVALTGAKSTAVHDLALSCGAHACIVKDLFEPCDLHLIVQDALVCARKARLEASA